MGNILLKSVTLDDKKSDILISGNRIEKIIFRTEDDMPARGLAADRVINCTGKRILPGFVNMHTHAAMTLFRGGFEDLALEPWLQNVWSVEDLQTEEDLYWGTKLAILEMIKTGTTCYLDMYWYPDFARKAAEEMGIRANITYCLLDGKDEERGAKLRDKCVELYEISRNWPERIRFGVSVHADYTNTVTTMEWARDFAASKNLLIHAHISETESETRKDIETLGMTPAEHFDKLGLLGPNTILAHSLWLSDSDIELFGKRKVSVVHNINSNLKLASGYKFKYNELRDAGVNICLGTDGAASSNNLDMREAAKTMALMQKAWRGDPSALPLNELINVATVNGSRALGLETGVIKEGAIADVILVDTSSEAFVPDMNFLANFIYSANSSCIDTVICDGKILMENRHVPGEEEIISNSRKIAENLFKKSGKWTKEQ